MCTVIIHVPEQPGEPTRLVAVRDEDPARPWNALGEWWPQRPGVTGVRDIRAGGAWLAADAGHRRLAVLLNRADESPLADNEFASRGGVVLDAVAGHPPADDPRTRGFHLVSVDDASARVITWDGRMLRTTELAPGTHMIAHDDIDDPHTARIARWLDDFRATPPEGGGAWWTRWLEIIARSAELGPDDDQAIIRDNRVHGYPTQSLLLCVASIGKDRVDVRYGELAEPGHWNEGALS